jgi:hypothetical protein
MIILILRVIVILTGLVVLMIGDPHQDTACSYGAIWSHRRVRSSRSSEVDSRGRVQGHGVRTCRYVMIESFIDRFKIGSRDSNEVVI